MSGDIPRPVQFDAFPAAVERMMRAGHVSRLRNCAGAKMCIARDRIAKYCELKAGAV